MFLKWSRTIHKNVIVIRKFIFLKVWLMCCPYIILFILIWWTTNIESSCLIANSNEQNRSVSINAPCCSSVNSFIVHPILSILHFQFHLYCFQFLLIHTIMYELSSVTHVIRDRTPSSGSIHSLLSTSPLSSTQSLLCTSVLLRLASFDFP
jgi:hypothetical protein